MAREEDIESFVGITGADRTAAERVLELCGSELEQAIQLWFTDEDLQRSLSNVGPSAAATTAPANRSSRPNRAQIGREDAQGVIHIDSDDDVPMTEDENDDGDEVASVARRAQEEEDAAMAKRLQDELFSGPGADEPSDAVRAPMARTTETLVGPSFGGDGDDDDAHAAVLEQMRRRQQARTRPTNNPFAQSVWEDNAGAPGSASSGSGRASHLANLFRPPYELMSQISWDEARDEGKDSQKWILVNLQDTSNFSCQALNRDIWKDEAIKSLVQENFIFLQYDKNNMAAEQYITFYLPNEGHQNADNYPHVAIVDPRTGEQVKVFSGSPFPNALEFHAQLAEFLDRYSLSANSKNPVPKAKRPERVVDVDRMTEEEMLEMALQNSLNANGGAKQPNIHDPDELTKSTGALVENGQSSTGSRGSAAGEPAAGEPAAGESAAAAPQESAFARIPSDRPHIEPPADPKTTARLQVRNPPGRIIRRFRLDEPVSRIYEWLKAEPLPGKEGVEFELKSMPPQSADLIEHLDETIQDAGLANAVVMLEFI